MGVFETRGEYADKNETWVVTLSCVPATHFFTGLTESERDRA